MTGSPYLEDLLNRWAQTGNDLRKEAEFQKDLIEPLALAAQGNRLALRERRRRQIQQLEELALGGQRRWDERLSRIEDWRSRIDAIGREESHLRRLLSASFWLAKAREHQAAFRRRIGLKAEGLRERQQLFHEKILIWKTALEEGETRLQPLFEKEQSMARPLYVSRARKRPELEFAQSQQAVNELLGSELQQLRRSFSQLSGRLEKARRSVEQHASGTEILYEVHKQEILAGLRESQEALAGLRDEMMSDALIYEACRSAYRRISDAVRRLRCIEDFPQRPPSAWRRMVTVILRSR